MGDVQPSRLGAVEIARRIESGSLTAEGFSLQGIPALILFALLAWSAAVWRTRARLID